MKTKQSSDREVAKEEEIEGRRHIKKGKGEEWKKNRREKREVEGRGN